MGFETMINTSEMYCNGSKWMSNSCGEFEIIGRCKNQKNYYICKFEDGTDVRAHYGHIKKGNVKNPYSPLVAGVGYFGNPNKEKHTHYKYNKWAKMIHRCYNEKDNRYYTCGKLGIKVCDRWHSYENFLEDFDKIEGYNEFEIQTIDKDIKQSNIPHNKKVYSLKTTCLISKSKNSKEQSQRNKQYYFTALHLKTQYKEVCFNQINFAKKFNLKQNDISKVINGYKKSHKGWIFYKSTEEEILNKDNIKITKSQEKELLELIKNYTPYCTTLAIRLSDNYQEIIKGNVKEFCDKYALKTYDISNYVTGRCMKSKGWVFKRLSEDTRLYKNREVK